MNKQQFLKELERHLARMPKDERDDILSDFVEYFECAASEGEDESALCARLGDPRKLAKEYSAQSYIASANETKKHKNVMRAFAFSAGLGIVNFLYFVFVVSIGYIIISAFYIAAVAMAAAGVVALIAAFTQLADAYLWMAIFASGVVMALGVLMFIGNMQLTKGFNKANMAFLNNISKKIKKSR